MIPLEHSSILRKPGDKQRPRCDNMGSLTTYTKFPNLYDTVDCHRQTVTCHAEWPRSLPKELLILSWAVLLRSYTRIADPVFLFDGKAMKVDIPQSSWAEVEVEGVGERDWSHTAFTLNKVSLGRRYL